MLDTIIALLILSSCIVATQLLSSSGWLNYQFLQRRYVVHLSHFSAARTFSTCVEVRKFEHSALVKCKYANEHQYFILDQE